MKCADPVLCYTNNGTRLFRNYSLASPIFRTASNSVFDCGKCLFCRKKKATELAVRCVLHASLYKQNSFLTLTYDERRESYHNNFQYSDIQEFKKNLRRQIDYHFDKKIQVFNVHEYGRNGKKHWHLVVFNHDFTEPIKPGDTLKPAPSSGEHPLYQSTHLSRLWTHGYHTIGNVTLASAMYQAQYTQKDLKNGNVQNKRRSHSKHSGIGRDYFLKHYEQLLRLGYIPFQGRKVPLPRYFQKIAHKHYSHFYERDNFYDLPYRNRLYTPMRDSDAIKSMADLYIHYRDTKQQHIDALAAEWNQFIEQNMLNSKTPDFKISEENATYDLNNKQQLKGF